MMAPLPPVPRVSNCSIQEACACVDRLFHAWPILPEVDLTVYLQTLTERFTNYPVERVRAACNEAVDTLKRRPTVAHMVSLLEKRAKEDMRHNEIIARYENYKPPPPPISVPKDNQSKDERTAFLNDVLKRYGFGPVGSVLKRI